MSKTRKRPKDYWARVWLEFPDGSEESFRVPAYLASNLVPVVAARVAVDVLVSYEYGSERHETLSADAIRGVLGGEYTLGGCPVCGCRPTDAWPPKAAPMAD